MKYDLFTPIQYKGETTYGTSGTPDTAIGSVQNVTRNDSNNLIYTRGTNRDIQAAIYGGYASTLSVSYLLHDFSFLRHFIGPITGDGAAQGSAYTLTEGNFSSVSTSAGVQAFTLEVGDTITDDKVLYTGCMGNDFTISGTEGAVLECVCNIIAQKPTDSGTATGYTEPSTLPWHFSLSTLKWGATPSTFTQCIGFSISYSNNLRVHRGAGNGRFIRQPIVENLDITFSITIRSTSDTYDTFRDDFYGNTNTPEPGTNSISPTTSKEFKIELSEGSGAGLRNADIRLDNVVIEDMSDSINVTGTNNLVDFTMTGRAFSSLSSIFVQWWTGTRS